MKVVIVSCLLAPLTIGGGAMFALGLWPIGMFMWYCMYICMKKVLPQPKFEHPSYEDDYIDEDDYEEGAELEP